MGVRWVFSCLLASVMLGATVVPTAAGPGRTLIAADGSVVRGRTLAFGTPRESDVILMPRGTARAGTTPDGTDEGLPWTAKDAAAGANDVGLPVLVDGRHEKGLGGGLVSFPGFVGDQDLSADERSQTLAPWQVITWALPSVAMVAEGRSALPDIRVGTATVDAWHLGPPAPFVLTEATEATGAPSPGDYVNGARNIFDTALGVITNAPTFDWHTTNLRNYINFSPSPQKGVSLDGVNRDPLSTGGNLFGSPGDFSSPSHFVRAVVFSKMSPQVATVQDAVMQGFHILDQFDIPEGAVPETAGSDPPYEITEWTTMSDLKALTFST